MTLAPKEILKRRTEIEQELVGLLKDSGSDFGLDDIKDTWWFISCRKTLGIPKNAILTHSINSGSILRGIEVLTFG